MCVRQLARCKSDSVCEPSICHLAENCATSAFVCSHMMVLKQSTRLLKPTPELVSMFRIAFDSVESDLAHRCRGKTVRSDDSFYLRGTCCFLPLPPPSNLIITLIVTSQLSSPTRGGCLPRGSFLQGSLARGCLLRSFLLPRCFF